MRVFKIITALVVSGMFLYVGGVAEASLTREIIKTRAVSVTYKTSATAYRYAHEACQKYWQRDIANIISERPSFSVEIVTVNASPKTISALCVSKKYINDDVRRVAKR
jgi:hypothetical protein